MVDRISSYGQASRRHCRGSCASGGDAIGGRGGCFVTQRDRIGTVDSLSDDRRQPGDRRSIGIGQCDVEAVVSSLSTERDSRLVAENIDLLAIHAHQSARPLGYQADGIGGIRRDDRRASSRRRIDDRFEFGKLDVLRSVSSSGDVNQTSASDGRSDGIDGGIKWQRAGRLQPVEASAATVENAFDEGDETRVVAHGQQVVPCVTVDVKSFNRSIVDVRGRRIGVAGNRPVHRNFEFTRGGALSHDIVTGSRPGHINPVASRSTVDPVRAAVAHEGVIAGAAFHRVIARTSHEPVVAVSTSQRGIGGEVVVARTAFERHCDGVLDARSHLDRVVAVVASDRHGVVRVRR